MPLAEACDRATATATRSLDGGTVRRCAVTQMRYRSGFVVGELALRMGRIGLAYGPEHGMGFWPENRRGLSEQIVKGLIKGVERETKAAFAKCSGDRTSRIE